MTILRLHRFLDRFFLAGLFAFLIGGCASNKESSTPPTKTLREHEKTFDPSKYRVKPAPEPQETTPPPDIQPVELPEVWVERSEKVMGFRVQLHSTTDMNEARATLAELKSRLDSLSMEEGRMDLVFDAPYYKVRYGDFLSKSDADTMRDQLHGLGFSNAWVVRDNIIRILREKKQ